MLDTIASVLKHSYQLNWITTRDGNASFRRPSERFLYVTPSGVQKQSLTAEMMVKLDMSVALENKDHPEPWKLLTRWDDAYQRQFSGLSPTGELPMHHMLQAATPENRVVLHLHPTHIVAAMYRGLDLQQLSVDFPEINRYTRVGPSVGIIPPISTELGVAVCDALGLSDDGRTQFDIVGLDRHGVVAVGSDAWSAFEHIERLEHICRIVLASGR